MKRDELATYSSTKLRYLTTGPAATAFGLGSTYEGNGKFVDAGALYSAALMAPLKTKIGPQDPWGNVKITTLEAFDLSKANSEGWVIVPTSMSTPEDYASLVGLPLVGLPSDGISRFSLVYNYLSVACGSFNQTPFPGGVDIPDNWKGLYDHGTSPQNTYWTILEEIAPGEVWSNKSTTSNPLENTSFFVDTTSPWLSSPFARRDWPEMGGRLDIFFGNIYQSMSEEKKFRTNRELLYVSLYPMIPVNSGEFGLNVAKYSLRQNHVEAMVRCDQEQCVTEKIMKSLSDTRLASLTGFEHTLISSSFLKEFPKAVTLQFGSSPTERFLTDTSSLPFIQRVGPADQDVAYVNVSLVPPELFSRKLSLSLNTFYQLSMQPTGYFGSLSKNLSEYGPDTLPVTDINAFLPSNLSATANTFLSWYPIFRNAMEHIESPFIGATTTANVTTMREIFVCNFGWLALLLAASGIIFVAGGVALVLKHKTLGPEIFGFVTSMTYDNPYVRIADGTLGGGTTMDAMERARVLKDVKVYIGDVRGDDDTGHIAMASGVPLRKLERDRLYS